MVKITVKPCSEMHTPNYTSRNPLESDVSQPVSHLNIDYYCKHRYCERNLSIDGLDDLLDRVACQLLIVAADCPDCSVQNVGWSLEMHIKNILLTQFQSIRWVLQRDFHIFKSLLKSNLGRLGMIFTFYVLTLTCIPPYAIWTKTNLHFEAFVVVRGNQGELFSNWEFLCNTV